jgi:hypothetical protein
MTSPHLLRPFSSRQLSLVAGDDGVTVFAVLGGRYAGPSVEAHVPTLVQRALSLPRPVHTVVFVDEPLPDAALVALVDDMVADFLDSDLDALAQAAPVSEAVKRVEHGRIVEGIERSTLMAVRAPEVIGRRALERAVTVAGNRLWANPTALVAETGGRIGFHRSRAPHRLGS